MEILSSIEALDRYNIIDTHNKPILVHGSDMNFYYCKYFESIGTANKLFKEFLVASFLSDWELNHAPFQVIKVLPEHIPDNLTIPKNRFYAPCFGSQRVMDASDLTKVSEDIIVNSRNRKAIKSDLLRLSFFDIWTCNEDRHSGNYNLLYKFENEGYRLYAIDHEACFNHQNFERGLVSIDYESSLIYSSFFSKLFRPSEFKNQAALTSLRQSLYICSLSCKEKIAITLKNIPQEWNVDIVEKEAELNKYLLNDEWFRDSWSTFLTFLQYYST